MVNDQPSRAAVLRGLHRPGNPLILPNAWDAASARAVAAAGFHAVATSSAAVAASLGHRDGEATPSSEMLDAVARIAAATDLPVTADLERGYRMPPAELVERLAATGAVGCNLEDSDPGTRALVDAARQADFLAAVREAARHAGVDLVINARIDTFLRSDRPGPGSPGTAHGGKATGGTGRSALDEALRRAGLYLAAGADCVYPIMVRDPATIRSLAGATGGAVNIYYRPATDTTPGTPSLTELAALGVCRVSFGGGLHAAAGRYLARMLAAIAGGDDPYLAR